MNQTSTHLLERDADGVWHLTQAGRDYLAEQTVYYRGYTVKMGLVGDALMYRNDDPETCIAVNHYTSRSAMMAWIDSRYPEVAA